MRWTLKPLPKAEDIQALSLALKVEPLVATLLLQRGIGTYEEAKAFFRPSWQHLHDPFLMADMEKAVERIKAAMDNGENILVYGDYDVDGTTAVALLASFLLELYPNVATYIPDRYTEGYGISLKGVDFADDNGFSLIIALDCGVKAIEQVAYAAEKGIDFIIGDHHRPGERLPDAVAVLDPKRTDCSYPYTELCGCGIAFKLAQGLAESFGRESNALTPYLDLVATAIAADIVPITGENRVLATMGLEVINTNPRAGFKAIINSLNKRSLNISDVVFIIAPRINAAGRMKHGQHAVDLLLETDLNTAMEFAGAIENYNSERKDLDRLITSEAVEQIKSRGEESQFTSVVYSEGWHKGVLGIVASRLTETYYRPTLVFTKSGDKLAASARSVKGFDVYNALQGCSEHLEQFGGHKYAAGLTMSADNYELFKAKFEEVVSGTIDPKLLEPEINIDLKITLSAISPRLLRIINQMAPFGPGNNAPVFLATRVKDTGYARGVGEEGKHLKVSLTDNQTRGIGGIGFNLGHKLKLLQESREVDVVFSLEENTWNGKTQPQLKIRDLRACSPMY